MAYPHNITTRHKSDSVTAFERTGLCSSNTATVVINLPHGAYQGALAFNVAGTSKPASVTVAPYVDKAQTAVGANLQLALASDAAALTTVQTLAATGTVRGAYITFHEVDSPLSGPLVSSIYGLQVTVSTTGGTGNWTFALVGSEV